MIIAASDDGATGSDELMILLNGEAEYNPELPTDYGAVVIERAEAAIVSAAVERATEAAAEADRAMANAAAAAADAAAAVANAAATAATRDPRLILSRTSGSSSSVASKIMAKFGHVEGAGLGAKGTGTATPLTVILTSRGHGIVSQLPPAALAPSRVVLLQGLVPRSAEPDDDLEQDVGDEAALAVNAIRTQVSVIVFQCAPAPAPRGCGVRVFVTMPSFSTAAAVIKALDGRRFAGCRVRASTFSEARFDALALAPTPDEVETSAKEEEAAAI